MRACLIGVTVLASLLASCRTAMPPVRFAPPGTDVARLRSDYPLSQAERDALTQDNVKALSQDQVDQIYTRLWPGPMPDGPFRGDLFFPRDRDGNATLGELGAQGSALAGNVAALKAEQIGRAFWRGKVFFRSQGILRNRIEDILVLRPFIPEANTIPKLTFDGQTTWLLFPALLSCGESRLDPTRRSIVIDYARGVEVEGYRAVPDDLAGPKGLNIRDEVRLVRPGFYLGRAYFGDRFALNFTLLDPAGAGPASGAAPLEEDCSASRQQ